MHNLIVLLTDFGLRDQYVGQMKGTILRHFPEARILDLSHDVQPFCVTQAAYILASSYKHFPKSTVFVSVIDPGVGSSRRILCAECDDKLFLAPDNGLLGLIPKNRISLLYSISPQAIAMSTGIPHPTFHGRDVFAPAAARLLAGDSLESLGYEYDIDSMVTPQWNAPVLGDNTLETHVLHVDGFGNVILNAPEEPWFQTVAKWKTITLVDKPLPIFPIRTYHDLVDHPTRIGLLQGSQGYLELAMHMASAAQTLGITMGDKLIFKANHSSP